MREQGSSDSLPVRQPEPHLTVALCFCVTIINTHSGQSASATQSIVSPVCFDIQGFVLTVKANTNKLRTTISSTDF